MHNIIADLLQYGGLTCTLYGILHFTGAAMGLYDEGAEGVIDANEINNESDIPNVPLLAGIVICICIVAIICQFAGG